MGKSKVLRDRQRRAEQHEQWARAFLSEHNRHKKSNKDHPAGQICSKVDFINGDGDVVWKALDYHKSHWIRSIESWKPKGKSSKTILRSLISHLLVKYDVPQFLYDVWFWQIPQNWSRVQKKNRDDQFKPDDKLKLKLSFFIHLGAGGSMKKFIANNEKWTPVMTKRMQHEFMQTPNGHSFVEAIRRAQVLSIGGSAGFLEAFLGTRYGNSLFPDLADEEFVSEAIQWFCNHEMLDGFQVGPLVDFFEHRRRVARAENPDKPFHLPGRSPLRLIADMEKWHTNLGRIRRGGKARYEPSGFSGLTWKEGSEDDPRIWLVDEILTSDDLIAEGRKMSHCVASYSHSIVSGRTSIWSLSVSRPMIGEVEKRLTIEVNNRDRNICQARGKRNKKPTNAEFAVMNRWATQAGLNVSRWV